MNNLKLEFHALREMADVSTEGVVIYSLIGHNVIYSNPIAFNLLGLSENSTQKDVESVLEVVVPEDREYIKNQYLAVDKKPVTTEVEFRLMRPDKGSTYVCCNAYLISEAIIVFIRDITKPKIHENYLVEFGARKDTVLDTLMHHMNGALNLMQQLSSEAEKYVEITNDKNLKIYLGLLRDNSGQCLEIIYDLLKKEHEVSPKVSVKNTRIDVIEKISIIYDELRQSYRSRKFLLYHSDGILYINTDEVKLMQVVNNLASNAIKFSPSEEPIIISIIDNAKEVVISVQDHGIGIPEELHPSIFERQIGIGRTGLNGEKSMGLGLSICKNLMHLLQGKIWFKSKEGGGSTFYISVLKKKIIP